MTKGKTERKQPPAAVRVAYLADKERLMVQFSNGWVIGVPSAELLGGDGEQAVVLVGAELLPDSSVVLVPATGAITDIVATLIRAFELTGRVLSDLGSKGGRSTSAEKVAAARANGARRALGRGVRRSI